MKERRTKAGRADRAQVHPCRKLSCGRDSRAKGRPGLCPRALLKPMVPKSVNTTENLYPRLQQPGCFSRRRPAWLPLEKHHRGLSVSQRSGENALLRRADFLCTITGRPPRGAGYTEGKPWSRANTSTGTPPRAKEDQESRPGTARRVVFEPHPLLWEQGSCPWPREVMTVRGLDPQESMCRGL